MVSVSKSILCCAAALLANCASAPKHVVQPMLAQDHWRSYDGKEMPCHTREVPRGEKVRAVVITIHGLSGAASDFWMLEENWPPRGIAVYGMELRGQGNDPDGKQRGDIRSAKLWQEDLRTFHDLVRAKHPGVPVFWYAESLGGLIALNTHLSQCVRGCVDARPAGIIFSSPAAGLKMQLGFLKHTLIRTAMFLLPRKKVNLEKLAGVKDEDIRVTANTTHEAQMALTPHYVPEFTLRLLRELNGMIESSGREAQKLTVPVLVLASPNDVIASPEQIRGFFEKIGSRDKEIRWYEKSYHLLLHDAQHDEVLHDATQWIESHLGTKTIAATEEHR